MAKLAGMLPEHGTWLAALEMGGACDEARWLYAALLRMTERRQCGLGLVQDELKTDR
jgi:hypothetical protein